MAYKLLKGKAITQGIRDETARKATSLHEQERIRASAMTQR